MHSVPSLAHLPCAQLRANACTVVPWHSQECPPSGVVPLTTPCMVASVSMMKPDGEARQARTAGSKGGGWHAMAACHVRTCMSQALCMNVFF